MTKRLAPTLTSYDFLKTLALALMILDHVGYFFFPDQMWIRAVGRFSAPIWLFLVGYARSRDIGLRMWVGMGILVVSNYVFGMPVMPVNILGTIIVCRMALDPLMNFIARRKDSLYPIALVLFFATLVTFPLFEYGACAMLIVMAGYLARNGEAIGYTRSQLVQFAGVAGLLYAFIQSFVFFAGFDMTLKLGVGLGMMGLLLFLTSFRPYEYPALTERLPVPISAFLRLCGRRTLEIYVLHLLAFKAAAMYLGTQDLRLFYFHIY